MKRRYLKTLLILLGASAIAFAVVVINRPTEPIYDGKKVSFWLDQKASGVGDWREITNAFYNLGPQAVPFIANRIRSNHSWLDRCYRNSWPHLPRYLRTRLSPPTDQFREDAAVNLLANIGPSAIPSLIRLLKDHNASVRSMSAWALGSFCRGGYAGDATMFALAGALNDSDANVRQRAVSALGEFGPKAVALVPALMARLKDDEKGPEQGSVVFVRAAAARTLGRIGTGAHLAVPQLKDLLSESESYLRMEATIALWRITRETDQTLPPLLNLLATTPDDSKWEIFLALGEMGPAAKSAVPVIISELKSTDAFVRQRAAESLHKIDPSQLPEVTPSTQPVTQHQ